jgi:hypothetical protein
VSGVMRQKDGPAVFLSQLGGRVREWASAEERARYELGFDGDASVTLALGSPESTGWFDAQDWRDAKAEQERDYAKD